MRRVGIASIIALLVCAIVLIAQSPTNQNQQTGEIRGKVADTAGAAVPGARVLLLDATGNTVMETTTDGIGDFVFPQVPPGEYQLRIDSPGFRRYQKPVTVHAGWKGRLRITLDVGDVAESIVLEAKDSDSPAAPAPPAKPGRGKLSPRTEVIHGLQRGGIAMGMGRGVASWPEQRENYAHIQENRFQSPIANPLSTFSIDVDTASYANMRRFVRDGSVPPKDAIRTEEWINYFRYRYPEPRGEDPVSISLELSSAPWQPKHQLARIGLKARSIETKNLPPANLVFLLDVSGSMGMPDKLPLLQRAFSLLAEQLRPEDEVAIVVYAGAAGVVLEPTSGKHKEKILDAINRLHAGGSTAGAQGIQLAYKTARANFKPKGNNRVILATDGDFNVGVSTEAELIRLIENERKSGIFLTVLGFGTGNLQDAKMEALSKHGNGNYAYVDSLLEARKVLVQEMGGSLMTVAKDVKLQIEFNPAKVQAYRLIGYENRLLNAEDFNDDKKDAGEMGAGHTVTALYEIVPAGVSGTISLVDDLKYQKTQPAAASRTEELLTVKLRYKQPDGDASKLLSAVLKGNGKAIESASEDMRFAVAVAELAMLLSESEFKGSASFDDVVKLASGALGEDPHGHRAEFVYLAKTARSLPASE